MTTFDGAGVAVGRDVAVAVAVAVAARSADERHVAVEQAERDERDEQQADDRQDRAPASGRPSRRSARPRGDRGRRRPSRHDAVPATSAARHGAARIAAASGMAARRSPRRGSRAGATRSRRTSGSSSRATTSTRSPSWTASAMSGRPNAIPSRTSRSRRSVSWVWPPVAARTRVTVRPRTATSGSGLPGPHGARPASSRYRRVVDVERRAGRGRSRAAGRGSRRRASSAARARNRSRNASQRSVGELEAGRAGVAAVADEQVGAALEGRAEVERAVAPARGPDDVAEVRPDDRRAAAVLGQAGRDEADDPDRPRAADDRRARRPGRVGDGRPRLGDGRPHQVAPGQVRRLERVGVDRRPRPGRRRAAAGRPRAPPPPGRRR